MSNLAIRADASAERWTLDLDVAALAKMAEPLNIRRTIVAMMNQEILNDYDVWRTRQTGGGGAPDGPLCKVETITVPIGSTFGFRQATQYRLNDDAAILVLSRLRTPDADRAIGALVSKLRDRVTAMVAAAEERLPAMLEAAREEGRALAAHPAVEVPLLADPRPMFVVGHDHRPIVETLIGMLREKPGFCFDGFRLFLVVGQPPHQVVYAAKQINVIERLCSLARWEKVSVAGRRSPAEPPSRIVRIIIAAAREWAPRPPPDMFEQRLDAYLATFRVGTHLPLLDILRDVYQMREPSKTMFTWGVAELTKRGWEPVKGSRAGLRQEFYKSPIPR
jgi:hypothetical protein